MPKTYSTPSFSRQSTKASAARKGVVCVSMLRSTIIVLPDSGVPRPQSRQGATAASGPQRRGSRAQRRLSDAPVRQARARRRRRRGSGSEARGSVRDERAARPTMAALSVHSAGGGTKASRPRSLAGVGEAAAQPRVRGHAAADRHPAQALIARRSARSCSRADRRSPPGKRRRSSSPRLGAVVAPTAGIGSTAEAALTAGIALTAGRRLAFVVAQVVQQGRLQAAEAEVEASRQAARKAHEAQGRRSPPARSSSRPPG